MLRYDGARAAFRLLGETRELAGDLEAQRRHLATGLLEVLGGVAVVNGRQKGPGRSGPVELTCSAGLTKADREALVGARALVGAYTDPTAKAHIAQLAATRSTAPITATRQELVSDREWYASEYMSEHRSRSTGFDHTVCTLRRGRGAIAVEGIVVFRQWGDHPFDEHDAALLDLVHVEWAAMTTPKRVLVDPLAVVELSPRERETLRHLVEGRAYKEIADRMRLTTHTVNEYVKRIYRKLDVHSRGELQAMWARRPSESAR